MRQKYGYFYAQRWTEIHHLTFGGQCAQCAHCLRPVPPQRPRAALLVPIEAGLLGAFRQLAAGS